MPVFEGLFFNAAVILIGFILLSKAASEAIKRVITLARHWCFSEFAISFLFIGLVAILPEMLIGIISAFGGVSSFGAGVVIGSNIADLTLIVGIVALFTNGIRLHDHTFGNVKKLFVFTLLPFVLFIDGSLSRIDGLMLICAFILYLFLMLRRNSRVSVSRLCNKSVPVFRELLILFFAVGIMILSAYLITNAAEQVSSFLALPIFFIGVVIAIGTCLPELILSLKSNRLRHGELGLGDVLGNVFADCLLTLGVIAVIAPITVDYPLIVLTAIFLMIFSMLALVILSRSENRISKDEGLYLIMLYFLFLAIQFGLERLIAG
ncbi:MAG: hypothetical protein WC634_01440 [archaeon]